MDTGYTGFLKSCSIRRGETTQWLRMRDGVPRGYGSKGGICEKTEKEKGTRM